MKALRAEIKLQEAQFFLKHLQAEARKATGYDWRHFGFYLSAFLNAARSVRWVLKKEAKDAYSAWSPRWDKKLSSDDHDFLRFMNEQRISEVKKLGAVTVKKRKLIPAELVPGVMVFRSTGEVTEAEAKKHRKRGLPPSKTGAWIGKPEYFFKIGDELAEVTVVCKRYVTLLERLLREFKEASENPSPS